MTLPTAAPALAGLATGLRTSSGVAAVLTGMPRAALPRPLRHPAARRVSWLLAAGELVADKLPSTPSRTEPPGLGARLVCAAGCAVLLARASGADLRPAVAVGAGAALGSAFGGHAARVSLARRLPPVAVALVEDAVAATLAVAAVRVARPAS